MSSLLINLRKRYNIYHKDISELLQDLQSFELMKDGDNVTILLPEKDQASDLALTLIWVKLKEFQNTKCKKTLKFPKDSINYFDERQFFKRLTNRTSSIFSPNIYPFNFDTFNLNEDENETAQKISSLVNESIGGLELSSETKIHIQELVSNAFHHSQAIIDVGCTSKVIQNNNIFEFYIADQGKGIKKSFSRNKNIWSEYQRYNDAEILEIATKKNITCNPDKAPQYTHKNSGIGLYFLKEFCLHQKGHLVIISGKGYYYIDKNRFKKKILPIGWPGTMVAFKVDLTTVNKDYLELTHDYVDGLEDNIVFQNI